MPSPCLCTGRELGFDSEQVRSRTVDEDDGGPAILVEADNIVGDEACRWMSGV